MVSERPPQVEAAEAPPRSAARSSKPAKIHFEREIRLHIYVFRRDGRWIAESMELALMGEGTSPAEAEQCVLDAIEAYLMTVMNRGWLELLDRKTSMRRRLELRLRLAFDQLKRQAVPVRVRAVHF